MNHAADINRKRMDQSIKDRRRRGEATQNDDIQEMTVGGKKLTDMTSEEYASYLGSDVPRPRYIKTKKPE